MAIHRITRAANDFYIGARGLDENSLQASFNVLSNDPAGARLWSLSATPFHALGGSKSTGPKTISIVDDGVTYTGVASIVNGRVVVDFSQSSAAIRALGAGEVLTGAFYYQDRLSNGQYSGAKVTFTITGQNRPATIFGDLSATVPEDGTVVTQSATAIVNDPDPGEAQFQPVNPSDLAKTYGAFTFNPVTGYWVYTFNNAAAQSLGADDVAHELLTITSLDGTATSQIDITVTGVNDPATITGKSTDTVGEDGVLTVGGTLSVDDPDEGEASYQFIVDLEGTYGTFSFTTATGEWGYTLNNAADNVQALITGDVVEDTLVVTSLDGSDSVTITVNIEGKDDPAQIGGVDTGEVTEDGVLTTGFALTIEDPDFGQAAFTVPADLTGDYGTFTFDADGNWTYTIVNDDTAFNTLEDEQYLSDTLEVFSIDGTPHTINVTIIGNSNDGYPIS